MKTIDTMSKKRIKRVLIAFFTFVFLCFFIPVRFLEYKLVFSIFATLLTSLLILFTIRKYNSFFHFIQTWRGKTTDIKPKAESILVGLLFIPALFFFYYRTSARVDYEIEKNGIIQKVELSSRHAIDQILPSKRNGIITNHYLVVKYSYNKKQYIKEIEVDETTFARLRNEDSIYVEFSRRNPSLIKIKN